MRLWPATVGHGSWVAGAIPRVGPSGSIDPRHCRRGIALLHERPIFPRRPPTAEHEEGQRTPCEVHRWIHGVRTRPSACSIRPRGWGSQCGPWLDRGREGSCSPAPQAHGGARRVTGGNLQGGPPGSMRPRGANRPGVFSACAPVRLPANVTPIGSCHHPKAPTHPFPRPVGRGGMSGFPSGKRCVSRVTLELGRGCVLGEESYNIE